MRNRKVRLGLVALAALLALLALGNTGGDCVPVEPDEVVEYCFDGIDNDLDGQTDCDDTDCVGELGCGGRCIGDADCDAVGICLYVDMPSDGSVAGVCQPICDDEDPRTIDHMLMDGTCGAYSYMCAPGLLDYDPELMCPDLTAEGFVGECVPDPNPPSSKGGYYGGICAWTPIGGCDINAECEQGFLCNGGSCLPLYQQEGNLHVVLSTITPVGTFSIGNDVRLGMWVFVAEFEDTEVRKLGLRVSVTGVASQQAVGACDIMVGYDMWATTVYPFMISPGQNQGEWVYRFEVGPSWITPIWVMAGGQENVWVRCDLTDQFLPQASIQASLTMVQARGTDSAGSPMTIVGSFPIDANTLVRE